MTTPAGFDALFEGEDDSRPAVNESTTNAKPDANTPTMQGRGPLLEEEDEKKVAETIAKWLKDQSKARRKRRVVVAWIKQCLKGVRGLQIRPSNEDVTEIELYRAPGMLGLSTIMMRARQLIERVVAHLLSDPPAPDAEPEDDSDMAKEAADLTSRILTIEGSESGFNTGMLLRRALRKASIHGSAFLYPCIDPTGGGWRPMEIEALPEAQTVNDATIDPDTNAPLAAGDPRLELRYVRPDKTLSDSPAEAERQWMPKFHVDILTPDHVALLPEACSGIGNALGAIVIRYPMVSELRGKFPKFAKFKDEDIKALLSWRPEETRNSQPFDSSVEKLRMQSTGDGKKVDDSARLCTLTLYFKSHSAYPTGAYIVVSGDRVLHKQPWSGMVENGENVVEECLDVPLAQLRQIDDDEDDDPMGRGIAFELCEIDGQRSYILDAWNDHLDRITHPWMFVPLGSTITPAQLQLRTGEPLYFNPQGKPEMEKVDPFPADGKEYFDRTTAAGNDSVGLEETAQGTEVSSVTSGAQAAVVVQQAAKNLSGMKHNTADCVERFWRIVVQQWRVFFTIPMQAKYLGDDQSWKTTEWSRADFGSTRVIRIKPGTFTQLTAEQKEAKAAQQLQTGVIDQQQFREVVASGIRPTLGIRDNAHVVRIKRQISLWDDGPPEQWQPPAPPMMMDQMGQQVPAVDPMTGQPMPAPPDPANPFADRREVDQDRAVATIRYQELALHQSEASYIRKPAPWRAYYVAALNEARLACGAYTLAEQQQAQAQQVATEQAGQAQERTADKEKQSADHAHEERKLSLQGSQRMAEAQTNNAAKAAQATNRATALVGAA
jgi:hypothetical protein